MSAPNPNQEIFARLRPTIEEHIKTVNGMQLPDNLDSHLIDLLAEIGVWIPRLKYEITKDEKLADITFSYDVQPVVRINPQRDLHPREWGAHDPTASRTCAFLHEVMHAACDSFYEKPPQGLAGLRGVNFDVSRALDGQDDKIIAYLRAQMEIVLANFDKVKRVIAKDNTPTIRSMQDYLLKKIDYAEVTPQLHYDPILFELLLYIALIYAPRDPAEIPTFKYVRALSREAAARRVAPAIRSVAAGPSPEFYFKPVDLEM